MDDEHANDMQMILYAVIYKITELPFDVLSWHLEYMRARSNAR